MLTDEICKAAAEIAARYSQIDKIILFGSRARGDCGERSDIDLAVYADGDISEFIYDINEEVPTLLMFDVTHMDDDLDEEFIGQVEKEGRVIYEKS